MMNRSLLLAPLAIAALALTACSNADTSAATSEPTQKSDTQVESEAIPKSERGNIVKKVGETSELKDADGVLHASFTVNSIEVDPTCTGELATPPERGHFVVVDLSIETTPDYEDGSVLWGPWGWKVIDAEGVTLNDIPQSGSSVSCLPNEEMLAGETGPGEKREGKIVLDVPTDSGILAFNSMWEWAYPAE